MRRPAASVGRSARPAPRRPRRALRLAPIALVLAVAVGMPSTPAAGAATARTTLPVIERQVMCVTCKIPLDVAQSPQADRERAFIQSLIGQGYGEAQVKRALVAQYGQSVLGLPRAHGFDLSVYLVPAAVVLALLAMLAVLLPRWRRGTRGGPAAQAAAAPLDPSDSARLESDLARFD